MKDIKEKEDAIKIPLTRMFPDAIINNDLKKYKDHPANRKKVEEAKKFLSKFGYK